MKRRSGNMKEKYIIRVYLSSFYDVEVEADNLQDAKQQAESSENWDMVEIANNLSLQEGETQAVDEYPSVTVRTIGVEWDTDGMDEEELDLPSEVEIPGELDDEDVTDWLSDHYGFCLKSWYEI
jgi:hypothetical protein